jgi:hypothetical protein
MSRRQFYWQWIRRAFTRPLLWADLLAVFLAIVGGAVAYFWPQLAGTMTILLWLIPLSVFVILALAGLLLAPYYMQRETKQECDKLREQLGSAQRKKEIASTLLGFHTDIHQLMGRPITSDEELAQLEQDAAKLAEIHFKYIRDRVSPGEAELYARGVVHPLTKWNSYNDKHNLLLNKLERRRQNLVDLIRRFESD